MEDSAYTTAALVGVVLALVKLVEKGMQKGMQKANGGSIEYRLKGLESQIASMQNKLQDFQRAFYEFREESRIWRATNKREDHD